MTRSYRFFLRNPQRSTDENHPLFHLLEKTEPDIFFQLTKILRIKKNDQVTFVSSGSDYLYETLEVQKKNILFQFKGKHTNENELLFHLEMLLCLPNKPEKLEFIVQKAVELGVKNIILVQGDFSQMKHQLRPERLQKIILEAAEQSERAMVPALAMKGHLNHYLLEHHNSLSKKQIFVALERLQQTHSLQNLLVKKPDYFSVLIGPEGGFSQEEKKLIHTLTLPCFSLGKRILRMETAAILSLGLAALYNEASLEAV